jgi:hypothetical protein
MKLSRQEQETIINFNEAEDTAYIYTCNKPYMRHMEKVLGLKPVKIHGSYAREYECPKAWIKKPRIPRQLSQEQKHKLIRRLPQKSILTAETPCAVGELGGKDVR